LAFEIALVGFKVVGNSMFNTHNTPKIVGGITEECTDVARILYSQFIDRVVPVSSTECAGRWSRFLRTRSSASILAW
jgi:hypothetical protein